MGILDERGNLAGRVAVVLGGAGGLGRGITNSLARAGVDVAFCDIDQDGVVATQKELSGSGRKVMAEVADVTDPEQMNAFWKEFDRRFARLDILINVPGGVRPGRFLESTPQDWDREIRLNYLYVIHSSQEAARRMRFSGRGGSIINLTTIEAHRGAPGYDVYSGAKAAVVNFSRSLATELGPDGIRVNNIAPDTSLSPQMLRKVTTQRSYDPFPAHRSPEGYWPLAEEQAANAIPLGRFGRSEDIENCVLFLASDLASYITGQTLHADGGAFASSGWYRFPRLGFRNRIPFELIDSPAYGLTGDATPDSK